MKKIIIALFTILLVTPLFWSCEKDDICAEGTPTTPSIVLEFYDNENQQALKGSDFRYYEVSSNKILPEGDTAPTVSKIELPMLTNATTTTWGITYKKPVTGGFVEDTDFLTFNYTSAEIYVSRACGYKSIFFLDGTNPVELTDPGSTGSPWIKNITVASYEIRDKNETHIRVYF